MSGIEDIENSMEVPDPDVVVGENAKKRGTESPTSSANKKLKLDLTEGEMPASASPSTFGNGTASDQQNPESVQDEGEVQEQLDANDSSPPNEVGIPQVSNIQDGEPSTGSPSEELNLVIDLDDFEETPILAAEDVDNIYAHLPQLKKKVAVAEENVPGDLNLSSQPQEILPESVPQEPVPVPELDDLDVPPIEVSSDESEHDVGDADSVLRQPVEQEDESDIVVLTISDEEGEQEFEVKEEQEQSLEIVQEQQQISMAVEEQEQRSEVAEEQVLRSWAVEEQELEFESEEEFESEGEEEFESEASEEQETETDEEQQQESEAEEEQDQNPEAEEEQQQDFEAGEVQDQPELEEAPVETPENRLTQVSIENREELETSTAMHPRVRLSKAKTAQVSDFEILHLIGLGAFGRVFVVRKENGCDAERLYAMKAISKMTAIHRLQTAEMVKSEREVLEAVQGAPFLVCLQYAFQDSRFLYMVMDFVPGGEMYRRVQTLGSLPEKDVLLYTAEVMVAVEFLHEQNILYRDLKLENLLIDSKGHIVLADLGLATFVTAETEFRAYNFCGTLEYMAPEVLKPTDEGYGKPADWWSLGVIIVEMHSGISPFTILSLPSRQQKKETQRRILHEEPRIPSWFGSKVADLVKKLLVKDSSMRLDASGIRQHPFFQSMNWTKLRNRRYRMPFLPRTRTYDDVQHFDPEFTNKRPVLPNCTEPPSDLEIFKDFEYTSPQILDWMRMFEDESIELCNNILENRQCIPPPPKELKLGEQVFSGSFGTLFLTERKTLAKVIHLSKFRIAEVDALMSFSHPNVVKYLGSFRKKTEIWIITENLEGQNLKWFIRNDLLNERLSREIFLQLVNGLLHIHGKHFIHGDVKPENVVCGNLNLLQFKLVDLGNASYRSVFTQWPEKARYTIDYAPPELLKLDGLVIYSPAVDVYSLGATLYTMVVGYPPFRICVNDERVSADVIEILKENICRDPFNQVSSEWRNSSEEFRNLVRGCLQKDPGDRPQLLDLLSSDWMKLNFNTGQPQRAVRAQSLPIEEVVDEVDEAEDEAEDEAAVGDADVAADVATDEATDEASDEAANGNADGDADVAADVAEDEAAVEAVQEHEARIPEIRAPHRSLRRYSVG